MALFLLKFGQLVHIRGVFRDDGRLCTGRDGAVLGQETGIPSHHLHKEDAVVGVGGVTDLVHAFHDGIEGAVVADGGVCAVEVVIDSAGQADDGEVVLPGEELGAGEGAVAADYDEGVNLGFHHILVGYLSAFRRHKGTAAGGFEDGSAALDGVGYAGGCEFHELFFNESLVTSHDAHHVEIVETGRAGDGTDGSVHSRSVSSGSENADGLYISFHKLYKELIRKYSQILRTFAS